MSFTHAPATKSHRHHPLPSRRRHHALAAALEHLEPRCLLSGITTLALDPAAGPFGITHDSTGAVWYADAQQGLVTKVTLDVDQIPSYESFTVNGNAPSFITFNAADGNLYAATFQGTIDQINPATGFVQEWTVATDASQTPVELTVGGDGAIWFTTQGTPLGDNTYESSIGRLNLTTGATEFFTVTPHDGQTLGITTDTTGNVWFTVGTVYFQDIGSVAGTSHLGRIAVGPDGFEGVSYFGVPTSQGRVVGIQAATDGSLWYLSADEVGEPRFATGPTPDLLGHVTYTPAAGGSVAITEYQVPKLGDQSGVLPTSLTIDGSGKIWFSEFLSAKVSRFDPSTANFTRYSVPGTGPGYLTAAGSDVWVTSPFGDFPALIRVDLTAATPSIDSSAPNIDATAGQLETDTLVTFDSASAGMFNYTIDYGDGSSYTTTLGHETSGSYVIHANHTYAAAGTYATRITIAAADGTGDTVSLTGSAVVAAPVAPGLGLTAGTVIHSKLFLLLANNDDVGTYFNITIEMLDQTGNVIASGTKTHDKVLPVTNNTVNPLDFSTDIAMTVLADTSFNVGDYFSFRVKANVDTGGHASGTLALQYDAVIRPSKITLDYGHGAMNYYLHSDFDNSAGALDSAQLAGLAPLNSTRVMDTSGNSIATGGTLNDSVVDVLKALCRLTAGNPPVTLGCWSGVIV